MPATDKTAGPRLFVASGLEAGEPVPLARGQSNYLANVLRLGAGAGVLTFNGRDGEWLCEITAASRKDIALMPVRQIRPQPAAGDLHCLFAPLKSARLDYMAQKAVEMGASVLVPVLTRRTQVSRLNLDRLRANAVEAAEQCGLLSVPEVAEEQKLERALAALEPGRVLIFCDEDAEVSNPVAALAGLGRGPLAVLIGPEGGFDESERKLLLARTNTVRLSLGPRILRADTAAVAALAIVQSTLGDWGSGG
jgi:16S rRNA (uracil1498-N3)-methyltransferase